MSANGTFSTTLDYEFFGGGYVIVQGEVSGSIDPSLESTASVLVTGQASGTIPYSVQAGIELPIVYGTADVSFGFDVSSTMEFGIRTFGRSEWTNRVEFTGSATGVVPIVGSLSSSLDFEFNSELIIFSLAESDTNSFGFEFSATGLNVSTHTYDLLGANAVRFGNDAYNGFYLTTNSNGVIIKDDGSLNAEILQR